MKLRFGLSFICLTLLASSSFANDERDRQFVIDVLPILKTKCFSCHGNNPEDIKGELDMTSMEAMIRGGESGDPALVHGKPDESIIVEAIQWDGYEMPPKENDRLNDEQIAAVRKWIEEGAVWPSAEKIKEIQKADWASSSDKGEIVKTSGGQSDDWTYRRYQPEDLWSIRPIEVDAETKQLKVDFFVDRKLADGNLTAASRADAKTLIRRACYDLIGLPPTPEQIARFEKDYQSDPNQAWSDLVDRLLASPQYGERWGQHWLDVVRYADTAGFSNDFELSNAWRYRDYVIRSFNEDKPFNQFALEQLAGDELFAEQQKLGKPVNGEGAVSKSEGQIATGFLRMGPWEHTAMTPARLSRQNYLDDVVNGVGQSFLSTALRCAKCHDHKFDPIPTKDYYRIYATFRKAQPTEMKAEFLDEENQSQFDTQRQHVERLLTFAQDELTALYEKRENAAKAWYEERGLEYKPWEVRRQASDKSPKPPRFVGLNSEEEGQVKVREQDVRIWKRRKERFMPLAQSIFNGGDYLIQSGHLRPPVNDKQRKRMANNDKNFILDGGSIYAESDEVTPGVLSCVGVSSPSGNDEDPYRVTTETDGRRLEFARWVANPDNVLATRSIVNRIWHYHFGKGIAGNPNNFGVTGAKPTHPKLLDWLTQDFVDNGWSIKHLHRQIMNSETYMRSTEHPAIEDLLNSDPNNDYLAVFQPRRLTAEEIRDTMLAASGELNLEMGGLPIRPEINREVALSPRMIQFSIAPAYQPEKFADQRNRRSIYAYRVRGLRDPLMEVLDKPNPNESCEVRDSASTTPQVFALMNGEVVTKRSIALANRLMNEADSIEDQIKLGFKLTVGDQPSKKLLDQLKTHFNEMVSYHEKNDPRPIEYPTEITRSLVEEFTGETFQYVELLDIYEEFEKDLEPSDVDAKTRALADICLLLFNSNQFMYVY